REGLSRLRLDPSPLLFLPRQLLRLSSGPRVRLDLGFGPGLFFLLPAVPFLGRLFRRFLGAIGLALRFFFSRLELARLLLKLCLFGLACRFRRLGCRPTLLRQLLGTGARLSGFFQASPFRLRGRKFNLDLRLRGWKDLLLVRCLSASLFLRPQGDENRDQEQENDSNRDQKPGRPVLERRHGDPPYNKMLPVAAFRPKIASMR